MSDHEKLVIECGSCGDRNRDETRKATGRGKDREKERKIEENQGKSNVTTVRGRENKRGDREESKIVSSQSGTGRETRENANGKTRL